MDSLQVKTAQNVIIDYTLASLGDRLLAHLLDGIFKFGYLVILMLILSGVYNVSEIFQDAAYSDTLPAGATAFLIIGAIPLVFYKLLFEIFNNGQSPGKMIMKIRVASVQGYNVSIGSYLLRWLFRMIDEAFMGIVGMICILISTKNQRLGDIVAQTTVIKVDHKGAQLKDTIRTQKPSAPQYQIQYPQVSQLTADDVQTIKKILSNPIYKDKEEVIATLANKTKATLGVESNEPDKRFLYKVIQDYNHYHEDVNIL